MSRFVKIADKVETLPLRLELLRAEELWGEDLTRRTYPNTPHAALTGDITARYMPQEDLQTGGLEARRQPHRNIFWPAWHRLPSLRPVVFGLMARVGACELGSILITRLPPGGRIEPHSDAGNWAPEFYNCKAHWTVQGTAIVSCAGEVCRFSAGEVWTFDNLLTHWIENDGDEDRISVIVSLRCD